MCSVFDGRCTLCQLPSSPCLNVDDGCALPCPQVWHLRWRQICRQRASPWHLVCALSRKGFSARGLDSFTSVKRFAFDTRWVTPLHSNFAGVLFKSLLVGVFMIASVRDGSFLVSFVAGVWLHANCAMGTNSTPGSLCCWRLVSPTDGCGQTGTPK